MIKTDQTNLLSILAHNVKSPVKYMQFVTDYTLRNWGNMAPKDLLECATIINDSARDITEMLDNLIYWAELNEGKLTPVLSNYNLKAWLMEEIKLHKPILKMKKLAIKFDVQADLRITSDPNLLSIAFQNVLTNALKFSNRGDSIAISALLNEHDFVLSVTDEGIGMKAKELDKLKTVKLFSSMGTLNEKGTGLGTRITKEIIGLLGGEVKISSQPDAGTEVKFILPNNR